MRTGSPSTLSLLFHASDVPAGSPLRDEAHLAAFGLLGSYRRQIGWGPRRAAGARIAVGPELPPAHITTTENARMRRHT